MDVHKYIGSPKLVLIFIHILLFANICTFLLLGSLLNFHYGFVDDLLVRGRFGSNREWQAHWITQAGGELRRSLSNRLLTAVSAVSSDRLTHGFLSCWMLKTSKDGEGTTSLGDCSHCSLGERGFPYIHSEALLSQLLPVVSFFCRASLGRAHLHHLADPLVGGGGLLLDGPWSSPFSKL